MKAKKDFIGLVFGLCILITVSLVACSEGEPPDLGTIIFTANVDCEIRLFAANNGEQIAHSHYETGKEPFVVQMTRSGIFVVLAKSDGKEKREPLSYVRGELEYHIEF